MPLGAEGEFALVKEQMETARNLAGQPVKRGTMAHDHDVTMVLAEMAAQLRDESALRQYAPLLQDLATRDGHMLYLAIAQRAWGVAHRLARDYVQSRTCLERAQHLFGELTTRWQLGRTLQELAELALAQGDVPAAREHLTRALGEFQALRAVPDEERIRASLSRL